MASALSAMPGYLLYFRRGDGWDSTTFLSLIAGIFLLSFAAGALNNIQDSRIDEQSSRTENRPLPSGRLDIRTAAIWFLLVLTSAFSVLLTGTTNRVVFLGILAMLIYNGLYTPLKRISPYAIIPGSLTGAIPPLMGHAAAGGAYDRTILWIVGFYTIWQMPHVFLILLRYGKNLSDTRMPTFRDLVSPDSLARIAFAWILAAGAFVMMIPLFIPTFSIPLLFLLSFVVASMILSSLPLLRPSLQIEDRNPEFGRIFMKVNLFSFITGIALSLQGVMGTW